jgi:hypothetical protein
MIIAESVEYYRLISQNDHGDLAGQFAAHWGNDHFAKPEPYPSMVLAAETHDNGWWDWDIYPSIDDNGAPIPFTRTPREFRSAFYGKGIDNVIARDPYAGLMVSMHGVGLPQKRYGTMPSMVDRDDPYSQKFIAEREPTHDEMIRKLSGMAQYAGFTSREQIWHNYLLMQVFDRLSLFFCSNFDITTVAAAGAHTKEGKAYYGATIRPTPLKAGDEQGQIQLRVMDRQTVIVDPYPFDESSLRVSVRGKLVPKITYKCQNAFRETYSKAQRQEFTFTLRKE